MCVNDLQLTNVITVFLLLLPTSPVTLVLLFGIMIMIVLLSTLLLHSQYQ
jgi:hypothetical protein